MRSLYKKQVILYIFVLLVTFAVTAAATYFSLSESFIKRERNKLVEHGAAIQEIMGELYFSGAAYDEFDNAIQVLEDYMDAQVFFVNASGRISMVTDGIGEDWVGRTITDKTIGMVLNGNITYVEGTFDGMFADKILTVGYPIRFAGVVQGGIFMCKSLPEIRDNFIDIYSTILIFMIAALIVGIIIVLLFTRRIVKPITEMNKAAKAIAGGNFGGRINIKSRDEVGQLAESFNFMAESLDETEQIRREMIANISHDLRSPITSIQGFLGAIEDGTIPPDKTDKYISIAIDETKRLSKLVENVMDMNKAQAGELNINKEEFSIADLIRSTVISNETRIRDKNIDVSLIFDSISVVFADYDKIARVIHNLIDNALKFTEESGHITVETTAKKDKLVISVKNSGVPISEEDKKHIFDRFYKGDRSRGLDNSGSGLGLAIVKELIKAHGETITVSSGEDYNEFVFMLDIAK
ncbi:MAG: HAMP domain-containing histidine kinase [Lachnospiraceae bacterium]|nr:HAMP domain-containing histidine kinase [Lachnospiraceae bacterium]